MFAGCAFARQSSQSLSNSSLCIIPHSRTRFKALPGNCPSITSSEPMSIIASNSRSIRSPPVPSYRCSSVFIGGPFPVPNNSTLKTNAFPPTPRPRRSIILLWTPAAPPPPANRPPPGQPNFLPPSWLRFEILRCAAPPPSQPHQTAPLTCLRKIGFVPKFSPPHPRLPPRCPLLK